MRWPWQKQPENRGTLTLLPQGRIVLGLPHDEPFTQEAAHHIRLQLNAWTADAAGKALIFPFPVDVVDHR